MFAAILRQRPLYKDIWPQMILYWLCIIGEGSGPLILSWINEICSGDTEKRALLVAAANDLAYVVQAVVSAGFPQKKMNAEYRRPTLFGRRSISLKPKKDGPGFSC